MSAGKGLYPLAVNRLWEDGVRCPFTVDAGALSVRAASAIIPRDEKK